MYLLFNLLLIEFSEMYFSTNYSLLSSHMVMKFQNVFDKARMIWILNSFQLLYLFLLDCCSNGDNIGIYEATVNVHRSVCGLFDLSLNQRHPKKWHKDL